MNVAYLFPHGLWQQKMSGCRRWYGDAIAAHPDVELKVWGEGWPNYKANRPLGWNLARWDFVPDRLLLYKPDNLLRMQDCLIPRVVAYNECWQDQPGRALSEVLSCGAKLVVHHHANDAKCFEGFPGTLAHIPHCAPDLFRCDRPMSERPIACLAHGVQSPEIYPVRSRLARLILSGDIPGDILKHPGYRLPHKVACDNQSQVYAGFLQSAKISLCCTSRYRYLLLKIIESMRAGCVVVTDAPDDPVYHELIRSHVLEINPAWSDKEIADCINRALAEPERLQAMADAGRAVAEQHFTTQRYAERFVEALENML